MKSEVPPKDAGLEQECGFGFDGEAGFTPLERLVRRHLAAIEFIVASALIVVGVVGILVDDRFLWAAAGLGSGLLVVALATAQQGRNTR